MENNGAFRKLERFFQNSRAGRLFWDRSFFHYLWTGGLFTVLNIVLVWFFIDVLKIPTIISSAVVIGGLFLGRFILYRLLKIM